MKSYTDIEQSRKLAEILPTESADMVYIWHATSDNHTFRFDDDMPPMVLKDVPIDEITADTLPCWSLTALLNVLSLPDLIQDKADGELFWQCSVYDEDGNSLCETYDKNPVDACVAMIEKLHELNLL